MCPVVSLRPEVELMYLLRIRRHCRHKSRRKWCRAPEMNTGALNSNMTSCFNRKSEYGPNCACAVKSRQNRRKAASDGKNSHVILEIDVTTESISIGSEYNQCIYCACADINVMFETHAIGQT